MTTVVPIQEPRTALAPFDQMQVQQGLQVLQVLLTNWRDLSKEGKTLADGMTPEKARASSSMLSQLARQGRPSDVARIIDRLLALYPSRGEAPASVQEDWTRFLADQPIASIWATYERVAQSPGQWPPSLGDFLAKVKSHASTIDRVRLSLSGGGGS